MTTNQQSLADLEIPKKSKEPEATPQEAPVEVIDVSKEIEAIDQIKALQKKGSLTEKQKKVITALKTAIGSVKLNKEMGGKSISLTKKHTTLWEEFQNQQGEGWRILNNLEPEAGATSPEKNIEKPDIKIEDVSFSSLERDIERVDELLIKSETPEEQAYLDKAKRSFETILAYFRDGSDVIPSKDQVSLWKEFKLGKGKLFVVLNPEKEKGKPEEIVPEKKPKPNSKLKISPTTKAEIPKETPPVTFSEGQEVKYKNDSGKIEDGWAFEKIEGDRVTITKKISSGILLKSILLRDFEKWQKEVLPEKTKEKTEPKIEAPKKPEPKPEESKPKLEPKPETKPDPKTETKPENPPEKIEREFSPEIKAKLTSLGIAPETLRGIEDFDKISDSEGKVLSVLEKIAQIKLKTIEKDANADHEKHVREAKGFFQKIRRSFTKKEDIQKRKYGYESTPLNIERHREEIEKLVHIADIGPDVHVRRTASGETKFVNEYFPVRNEWLDPNKIEAFNEKATAYSKLPPKYEWHKHPKKKKDFEKIEAEYQRSKKEIFDWSSGKERFPGVFKDDESPESIEKKINAYKKQTMLDVNDAEFQIKISQTFNHHPDVEMELKKLAETKGWRRDFEAAKAQILPGSAGFALGFGTRLGAKSALASVFGAVAIPIAVVGAGAGFGYYKGWGKAEKSLKKEEELLRAGFESQTGSSRKVDTLSAIKTSIMFKLSKASSENERRALLRDLEAIDKKIAEIRRKSTDDKFFKAESLVSKIEELEEKVSFEYKDYLKVTKGKTLTLEEFNAKKREWAEQLEVRLEFTNRKLGNGEISFGDDSKALANKNNLISAMGNALAVVSMNPSFDEKEIVNRFGNTRRSKLEKIALFAEMRISKNKNQYVRDQAAIGALTGGLMSGAGYQVGHLVSEAFGSHAAHAVQGEVQALKASGNVVAAHNLEKASEEITKASLSHDNTQNIINDINNAVKEVSKSTSTDNHAAVLINQSHVSGPSSEEMNNAVLEEANKISKHNADEYVRKLAAKALGQQQEDTDLSKIKFDLNTKASDFTNDLPKTSDVTGVNHHDVFSPKVEASPVVAPTEAHVETAKPFEYVLKNQTQSREYALIKYYESKGLSHHDAGTKANQAMREMYGPRGERATSFVHKGDHVLITEENGKPHVEVVSGKHVSASTHTVENTTNHTPDNHDSNTPEKTTTPSHEQVKDAIEDKPVRVLKPNTPAPEHVQEVASVNHVEHPLANHPIAEHLAKDPRKYGFKGDIKNPQEVKAWLNEHTAHLIDKNPDLKNVHPENIKEVYRTVTGGVHVETHPGNIPELLAHYEVKTPTSLPFISENILSKDPRWINLSSDEKDRVLYQLFVKEFIGKGHDASFYKGLGIKSGNPFDVKSGTLKLDSLGGKDSIDRAFASAHNSSLGIAKGFRNKIGALIQKTKGFDSEDIFEENIISILKQK